MSFISPRVVLVKYRPDPRVPRHGIPSDIEYQAKIVGVDGTNHWLDYAHRSKKHPIETATHWAILLGIQVEEEDLTHGWGREGRTS